MIDNKKIGKFILKEREKRNMTQDQLANQLYVTRQAVSKWERGITMPDYEILLNLCNIFNLTPNEIIAGERKKEENAEYIDNITIDVLKSSSQKVKRLILIFLIIIFTLVLLFLSYYFFSTFNKFHIYKISGESENFRVINSLAIISNESLYLKLEKVTSDLTSLSYIELYYLENNEKNMIYKTNQDNVLIAQNKGYNEYFKNYNMRSALSNLYLDVYYYDDETLKIETIKLEITKLYANNNLIFEETEQISEEKDNNKKGKNEFIPSKIEALFQVNENNEYVLRYKENNKNISIVYSVDAKCFSVSEQSGDLVEEFFYWINTKQMTYTLIKNTDIISDSIYDFDTVSCLSENCSNHIAKYNYFIETYINEYYK